MQSEFQNFAAVLAAQQRKIEAALNQVNAKSAVLPFSLHEWQTQGLPTLT
jgi:hypothetical protein